MQPSRFLRRCRRRRPKERTLNDHHFPRLVRGRMVWVVVAVNGNQFGALNRLQLRVLLAVTFVGKVSTLNVPVFRGWKVFGALLWLCWRGAINRRKKKGEEDRGGNFEREFEVVR